MDLSITTNQTTALIYLCVIIVIIIMAYICRNSAENRYERSIKKNKGQDNETQVFYDVIVELEHLDGLADQIHLAVMMRESGIKSCFFSRTIPVSGHEHSKVNFVTHYGLKAESEFEPFSNVMLKIDGVVTVKKNKEIWGLSREEIRAKEKERGGSLI